MWLLLLGLFFTACDARPKWMYNEGMHALSQGEYRKARRTFLRLIQDFPDNEHAPEAMLRQARILWIQEKRVGAAEIVYLDLMRDYPQSDEVVEAAFDLLELYREQPRTARKSLRLAELFIKRYPDDARWIDVVILQADLYISEGNYEQALLELAKNESNQQDPKLLNRIRVKKAQTAFLAGSNQIVVDVLSTWIKQDVARLDEELRQQAVFLTALAYEELSDIDNAMLLLLEIEQTYPNPQAVSEKIVALQERRTRRNR